MAVLFVSIILYSFLCFVFLSAFISLGLAQLHHSPLSSLLLFLLLRSVTLCLLTPVLAFI